MDKYFYEFIDELAYRLENYEDSKQWADWMRDSAQKYKDNGNLERFFRAFGGMEVFMIDIFIILPLQEYYALLHLI